MEKTVSAYLNSIREEFETWRSQRKGKEKIPERLWELAVKLTEAYPISFISHELKIDYSQLKYRSRVSASKQPPSTSTQPQESLSSEQNFYEVTANQLLASIPDPAICALPSTSSTNSSLTQNKPKPESKQIPMCSIVVQRKDGSRLSLNIPLQWSNIESLIYSFLRK